MSSATSAPATLRLGTRRSALALAQSGLVAAAITEATGIPVELVPIVSEGDVSRASLAQIGGTGVFATRLREALRAGECDLLVHSLKDLPTAPAPGLRIAAVPEREDARDVVVTRGPSLAQLPPGASIGTGSPRRVAQVARRAPRAVTHDLRGNVDSRLGRVRDGELDAVILAAAGLARLGVFDARDSATVPAESGDGREGGADGQGRGSGAWSAMSFEPLGLSEWPTAAGQGALAVEILDTASAFVRDAVAALEHAPTRLAVTAERAVLAGLEAGCHAPVGVHATVHGDELRVRAVVYGPAGDGRIGSDTTHHVGEGYIQTRSGGNGAYTARGADPIAQVALFGSAIARRLLERGAADFVSRESPE